MDDTTTETEGEGKVIPLPPPPPQPQPLLRYLIYLDGAPDNPAVALDSRSFKEVWNELIGAKAARKGGYLVLETGAWWAADVRGIALDLVDPDDDDSDDDDPLDDLAGDDEVPEGALNVLQLGSKN